MIEEARERLRMALNRCDQDAMDELVFHMVAMEGFSSEDVKITRQQELLMAPVEVQQHWWREDDDQPD